MKSGSKTDGRSRCQAQDVILFIDEIHNIIGAGAAEGSIDAANILKPQLSRGEIQLMGATTIAEYRRYIEKDCALERRFQSVLVEEPSDEQSVQILRGILPRYEQHHGVKITEEAVRAAVRLSRRYLQRPLSAGQSHRPDGRGRRQGRPAGMLPARTATYRRLDESYTSLREQKEAAILRQDFEQAAILRDQESQAVEKLTPCSEPLQRRQSGKQRPVTAQDIAQVVSESTGIEVSSLMSRLLPKSDQSRQLLCLEENLSRRVIGPAGGSARGLPCHPPFPRGLNDPHRSCRVLPLSGSNRRRQNRAVQSAGRGTVWLG